MKVGYTGGSFGRLSEIEFGGVGDILKKKKEKWLVQYFYPECKC